MPTYFRKDGSTFKSATRAIESLKQQTYTNWKLFLIGDKYEPPEEFEKLVQLVPSSKIYYKNLLIAAEREDISLSAESLWCIGGMNAANFALEKIKEENLIYCCRLDDDDYWLSNHLETLYAGYISFSDVACVYTKGLYIDQILPNYDIPECMFGIDELWKGRTNSIKCNNFFPMPQNVIHSSVSWNINLLPFKYEKLVSTLKSYPDDAVMWRTFSKHASLHNLNILHMPITTVIKVDEKGVLK
jgi:glycosyltransferase involved in cell wall biosynthesis